MVTIEEKYNELTILGRHDDPKAYQCKSIASYLESKIKLKIITIFLFETQFNDYRENLLKESLDFLSYSDSPIIYEKVKINLFRQKQVTRFLVHWIIS